MEEAILEMTSKGFGIATIIEKGRLASVITDGDLRRNISGLMEKTAAEVANPNPKTIYADALASEALGVMNTLKVTTLCVVDADNHLIGLVRMHDCLKAEVA